MGYSPWGPKEWDTTERLIFSLFFHFSLLLKGSLTPSLALFVGISRSGWASATQILLECPLGKCFCGTCLEPFVLPDGMLF